MNKWEKIPKGIRKYHSWGYSEVFMDNVEDCFTPEELDEVILQLKKFDQSELSDVEKDLLQKAVAKRKKI